MSLPDLFFLFSVLLILISFAALLIALIARKTRLAGRIALGIAAYLVFYALALVTVSLASPQQVLGRNVDRCFDDWCIAAVDVKEQPAIGATRAQGGEYALVTVRVSSRAKGIRQRAVDAAIYLLDESGRRYDPSPSGRRALEAATAPANPSTPTSTRATPSPTPPPSTCPRASRPTHWSSRMASSPAA
jgi:hypothetical protein